MSHHHQSLTLVYCNLNSIWCCAVYSCLLYQWISNLVIICIEFNVIHIEKQVGYWSKSAIHTPLLQCYFRPLGHMQINKGDTVLPWGIPQLVFTFYFWSSHSFYLCGIKFWMRVFTFVDICMYSCKYSLSVNWSIDLLDL